MASSADGPRIRLFVDHALTAGGSIVLSSEQSHYATNVMRLAAGDHIAVFNGSDGEWDAEVTSVGRRGCDLHIVGSLRAQIFGPDLWFVFAPVKRARIDFLAAKATELGASALWPVLTTHTEARRVNLGRLRANAIEAAEQCGRVDVPNVMPVAELNRALLEWPADRAAPAGVRSDGYRTTGHEGFIGPGQCRSLPLGHPDRTRGRVYAFRA